LLKLVYLLRNFAVFVDKFSVIAVEFVVSAIKFNVVAGFSTYLSATKPTSTTKTNLETFNTHHSALFLFRLCIKNYI